ncbi:YcxB family protein [Qipengyuania aquimaris]|uniref:YcxB family protein n=1 Tax=Qipengyuania aquimaris TaxID=255984 RepID=A0A9Q3S0R0_9SPHN|nr:YcxB family protein [Qipengyuania aquimaris]MBY6217680.1 YcxB family protein [Qipengyuania aquimaris]
MTEHSITQEYDLDLAVRAVALDCSLKKTPTIRRNIFVGMMFVNLLLLFSLHRPVGVLEISVMLGVATLVAYLLAWPPKRFEAFGLKPQIKARQEQLGLEEGTTTYYFDQVGMVVESDFLGGSIPWEKLHGWHDAADLLLIYRAPRVFYYLDKKQIDAAILSDIKDWLVASSGKQI